jgi:hypothetical protein
VYYLPLWIFRKLCDLVGEVTHFSLCDIRRPIV